MILYVGPIRTIINIIYMKICFICDSIYSFGGVQRVLAVIAKELSKTHDVTIITLDDETESSSNGDIYDLNHTNIKVVFFRFRKMKKFIIYSHKIYSYLYKKVLVQNQQTSDFYARSSFPAAMRNQLTEILNQGNYDTIIGVHAFLSLKLATIRKDLNAQKVIGWMHNSYQAFFENRPAYLEHLKVHFKYQMQKLDDVIVLTHTDAQLYKQHLGISPIVIYNPLTIIPGKRCDIHAKTFLSVGRMSPFHKGFDILITAFAIFAKQNSDWKLNIVGDGPERENLQKLINDNDLTERVTLYPFTSNIQKYYSSASVYVLSSRWEGFPLVLMEAMSHGLPIIASDIPVCREFFENTTFSIFFHSKNCESLKQALMNMSEQADIKKLSDGAMAFSQMVCKIENITKQWEEIL
jgi:glycosyltransferase involved in cell wall biosynthesis